MKVLLLFLYLLFSDESIAKEINYTASTPAGSEVREFLGISQADSIDFIRWKLKISDFKEFNLSCSYGIGRANTNGFIDEKKLQVKGKVNAKDQVITDRKSVV